ncbi:D-methionine transport system substrate-binding protein [Natranaerovirga pectinivora]|uniref:Lipoprotein n=1 Tax=Natranaerovirga pectinivora TaxID=682400 RepID=A0A4R3MK85_9FIRM|nr:MetQ/NlpA family ABC transporter substrate-binding protein [Natranaerovirga pectinivora]TCT14231.1 D-methionine transport system substrate-binding protein [Natranaerovirga pectinivora]
MKKRILSLLLVAMIVVLAGCSTNNTETSNQQVNKKLVVGATPVPHAEILEFVKPILEEQGIELVIREFTDYVTPNMALNEKQLDANFFQHVPYMNNFAENNNVELVSVATVHVEPMGLYSVKIDAFEDLRDGAIIAVPNDATNEGRALLLLQAYGLIKLADETGLVQTPRDIVENPKNLVFRELEAAVLPRVLVDVDAAVINTNFALEADFNPTDDALIMEDKDSPYANILTVRPDNKEDELIQALINVLNSDEVRAFILERYEGAIVPAF